ncbi:MAG: histidine--tRNA ligase [Patescibacteria group bacterium]
MTNKNNKQNTEPYKGVRDFYPEDYFVQQHIYKAMARAAKVYGYERYDASILEPTELYKAKTGEEIVNEQTYSFKDRGDRDVTLRPEMTPTVARMVAGRRRELPLPIRWYSIPNLFRYERPQKGRLREHYQLNADVFGISGVEAEIEVLSLARKVLLELGLTDKQFKIRINDRNIIADFFAKKFGLDTDGIYKLLKLLDKKSKIDNFDEEAEKLLGMKFSFDGLSPGENLTKIIMRLGELGAQIEFDPYIIRGFDYYTGTIFEFYDSGSENKRAICGGGRYDELLNIFGVDPLPTVGFGMGDVVARDLLETYNLLPKYKSNAIVEICPMSEDFLEEVSKLSEHLRSFGLSVLTNLSNKSLGDKVKSADKRGVPYIIVYGQDEKKTGQFKLKNLSTGDITEGDISQIVAVLKKRV